MNKTLLPQQLGINALILLLVLSLAQSANAVSVTTCGAVGNGTTDDASAINTCLAALPANSTLFFPSGNYRIASSITISKPVSLVGEGRTSSVITADAGITAFIVAQAINNARFEHLGISSAGTTRSAGSVGIKAIAPSLASGIGYLVIDNVEITGFDTGIDERFCQLGEMTNTHVQFNSKGLYQKRCVNMSIHGGTFERNTGWGIYIDGDSGAQTQSAGTRLMSPAIILNGANGGGNLTILHNEHFSVVGAMIDVPADGSSYNVSITDCFRANISGGTWIGGSKVTGVALTNSNRITVTGNQIISSAGFGISIDNCTYSIVTNNTMESNGNADVVLLNSSGTGNANAVNDNTLLSTGVTYSVVEIGANHSIVSSNRVKGSIILDGASVSRNNDTIQ